MTKQTLKMRLDKKRGILHAKLSIVIALLFSLIACETNQPKADANSNAINQTRIDSSKALLQNGNIILRTGNDVISAMFAQMNKTDQTFSHCGIAFFEDDKWWVYHSIGGEDNPDAKLRRETFERFVSKEHNQGFGICNYSLDSIQVIALHDTVRSFHQREIPFDMQFDFCSDDRFYCAEMVCKAYNHALKTDSFFNMTNQNGFVYVSTDNIFTNPKAKLTCHVVYE